MEVLKAGEGKNLDIFEEIKGEIIFSGERLMFLLVNLKSGQVVPEHRHPNEQMGICLKGKAEFISGENKFLVEAGMFYWMKSNEPHKVVVIEESTFLDCSVRHEKTTSKKHRSNARAIAISSKKEKKMDVWRRR